MAQKFSRLIPTTLMLILVACSTKGIVTPTAPLVSSSTPVQPTATSTPVALTERCVKLQPAFPEDGIPPWTLVVRTSEGIALHNFRQQAQRIITASTFEGIGTSPDGKWLSYIIFVTPNDEEIIVESPDGEKKVQLSFEREWSVYGNPWLGNEQLSFLLWNGSYDLRTVILNPFTGEQQILLSDYPNSNHNYLYGPSGSPPLFFGNSNVAYAPSLRLVVYPQATNDSLYDVLWDRQTKQEIAKVLIGVYLPPPLWLSDSRAFVVAAKPERNVPREWFIVNRDGKVRQLTHYGDRYPTFKIGMYASLSPDGHYLAFGLSRENDPALAVPMDLIILDLTTLKTFNTCITFDNSDPIWSPDSQYLVVQHPVANQKWPSIILLNVEAGWAASIFPTDNEYRYPEGWLDSGG
jgi:hypothetical protein